MHNSRNITYSSEHSSSLTRLNPHPPNEPIQSRHESLSRYRNQRYRNRHRNQSIDSKYTIENREIRSAGCTIDDRYNSKSRKELAKSTTKISSAPTRTFLMEKNSNLYQFGSKPHSVPSSNKGPEILPNQMKKKKMETKMVSSSSDILELPPPINTASIKPCISQASPIISDSSNYTNRVIKIERKSLQKMSTEKLRKRVANSLPELKAKLLKSLPFKMETINGQQNEPMTNGDQSQSFMMDTTETNDESSSFGACPPNWTNYRVPDDISDSFENEVLASMAAQSKSGEEKILSQIFSQLFKHNQPKNQFQGAGGNFMNNNNMFCHSNSKITPRTEALIGSSYSDEESLLTTGENGGSLAAANTNRLVNTDGVCCCCHGDCVGSAALTTGNQSPAAAAAAHQDSDVINNSNSPSSSTHHHHHQHHQNHPPEFHNEWKSQINCSQDTDIMSTLTSESTSIGAGVGSSTNCHNQQGAALNQSIASTMASSVTSINEFLSVIYIQEFDCYYHPDTSTFYEPTIHIAQH